MVADEAAAVADDAALEAEVEASLALVVAVMADVEAEVAEVDASLAFVVAVDADEEADVAELAAAAAIEHLSAPGLTLSADDIDGAWCHRARAAPFWQ